MTGPQESTQSELLALLERVNALRLDAAFAEAIALCRTRLDEQNPDLLALIGQCYYALAQYNVKETGENYDQAIEWTARASAIRPEEPSFHAKLGEYYWLGKLDYERAGHEFRLALSLAPDQAQTLSLAAALYGAPEADVTWEEATEWLSRATQLNPDDSTIHARLATLYSARHRIHEARSEWIKALVCPRPLEEGYAQSLANVK